MSKNNKKNINSYIKIELGRKNEKTSIYCVKIRESNILIGFIKWYIDWNEYCFFPMKDTIFNQESINDINKFIDRITKVREKLLNKNKS